MFNTKSKTKEMELKELHSASGKFGFRLERDEPNSPTRTMLWDFKGNTTAIQQNGVNAGITCTYEAHDKSGERIISASGNMSVPLGDLSCLIVGDPGTQQNLLNAVLEESIFGPLGVKGKVQ